MRGREKKRERTKERKKDRELEGWRYGERRQNRSGGIGGIYADGARNRGHR